MNTNVDPALDSNQQTSTDIEPSLEALAASANREHRLFQEHLSRAIGHAQYAGSYLRAAKERVGHGNFTAWLDKHFVGSAETARVYMRISREWLRLCKVVDGRHLSLKRALQILRIERENKPPAPTVEDKEATDVLYEHFAQAIKLWTPDQREFLAHTGDLPNFLANVQHEIGPLAPIFMAAERKGTALEIDLWGQDWLKSTLLRDAAANAFLDAFGHCRNLTQYQKSTIWEVYQASSLRRPRWLVDHLCPRNEVDELDCDGNNNERSP